jgi:hypothetical protein
MTLTGVVGSKPKAGLFPKTQRQAVQAKLIPLRRVRPLLAITGVVPMTIQ